MLDGAKVVAGFFSEEGGCVAERMNCDMSGIDTCAAEVFFKEPADHLGGEWGLRGL